MSARGRVSVRDCVIICCEKKRTNKKTEGNVLFPSYLRYEHIGDCDSQVVCDMPYLNMVRNKASYKEMLCNVCYNQYSKSRFGLWC